MKKDYFIYPIKAPEFEIHAELFVRLKKKYPELDIHGEVKYQYRAHKRFCDIVIFENKKAICLIEVKNGTINDLCTDEEYFKMWQDTLQGRELTNLGIKYFYCRGTHNIKNTIDRIDAWLEGRAGRKSRVR